MNKEFVPHKEALDLKELGFDEPCFALYVPLKDGTIEFEIGSSNPNKKKNKLVSAPTFSQAFRWFREKYKFFGCIDLQVCTPSHWFFRIDNIITNDYIFHSEDYQLIFNTYEEVELACLRKLIEITKNNK